MIRFGVNFTMREVASSAKRKYITRRGMKKEGLMHLSSLYKIFKFL